MTASVRGSAYGLHGGRAAPVMTAEKTGRARGRMIRAAKPARSKRAAAAPTSGVPRHRRFSQGLVVHLGRLRGRPPLAHRGRLARSRVRRCSDTPKRASTSVANAAPDIDLGACCR